MGKKKPEDRSKTRKIAFLITTRGNYGKTKTIIDNLDCEVIQYKPNLREPIDECALGLMGYAHNVLDAYKPDCLVLIADRWELLPFAIQAYYKGIPIAHVEGGETSGNIDEGIRHAVSKLASIHFPATKEAVSRLIRLGESPDNIHLIGATSFDLIEKHKDDNVGHDNYVLCTFHACDDNESEMISAVSPYNQIWIASNIDLGTNKLKVKADYKKIPLEKYAPLMNNALCIVGNSSSGIREAGFLGVPCVNIGKRQNTRTHGANVIDVPCEAKAIKEAIEKQIAHGRYERDYTYGDGKSGKRVADILMSTEFKTQKVWYER